MPYSENEVLSAFVTGSIPYASTKDHALSTQEGVLWMTAGNKPRQAVAVRNTNFSKPVIMVASGRFEVRKLRRMASGIAVVSVRDDLLFHPLTAAKDLETRLIEGFTQRETYSGHEKGKLTMRLRDLYTDIEALRSLIGPNYSGLTNVSFEGIRKRLWENS